MAGLFGKAKSTINEHIKNIFAEGELVEAEVMKKFGISEFQQKAPNYYNLDVIIDSAGESRKIPARNHQFLGVTTGPSRRSATASIGAASWGCSGIPRARARAVPWCSSPARCIAS